MNLCFLVLLVLLVWRGIRGYQNGLVNEVNHLISLVAALLLVGLGIMIYTSVRQGQTKNVVISVILIVLACLAYKLLHFVIGVVEEIAKMPLLNFLNRFAGLAAGLLEAVVVLWLAYTVAVSFPASGLFSSTVIEDMHNSELLQKLNAYNYLAQWMQQV